MSDTVPWLPAAPVLDAARLWNDFPGTSTPPGDGDQVLWWDGTGLQQGQVVGWWDGTTIQPAEVVGYWDGTGLQPVG